MKPAATTVWVLSFALAVSSIAEAQTKRGPFVQPPRSVRTRTFDTLHIRLDLTLNWDRQELLGRATHRLKPFAPTKSLELDSVDLNVERVLLANGSNGQGTAKDLKFEQRP